MSNFSCGTRWFLETLLYGPIYSTLMHRIRSHAPLDPEETWEAITRERGAAATWFRDHYPPLLVRRLYTRLKLLEGHAAGISAHYDASNAFYELFLDRDYLFYSCADFTTGQETLEEAQENKANYLVNLIQPQKGERILELGCGWGGMLDRIGRLLGETQNLLGYTLSQTQLDYNRQHRTFAVEYRDFITAQYPEEHFDKIYSIGAWEHVRPREIPGLLAKLYRALRPGGRVVHQFICFPSDYLSATAMSGQIFFPGSTLASYAYQVRSAEAAGFRIVHQSIHDYRPTLRAWHERLAAHRDRAMELVGAPVYNKYLVFLPAAWRAFQDREGMVLRIVMEKPA